MDTQRPTTNNQLQLVILGHVDHGKSTLIGRLLHDTGSLPEGKEEAIRQSCQKRGMAFEWAFLMDALQAERDQNVTIDTTQIPLRVQGRDITIIDAPGHREFLKNMITGAASADAALLLIDANEGMQEQSRRHAYLLYLLGIAQVAVLINKMDRVDYNAARFEALAKECRDYLTALRLTPQALIPISARDGDNVANTSARIPWYKGPSVLQALLSFAPSAPRQTRPLRFPVQDVYKHGDKRIIVGRIESGALRVGDTLLFSPANATACIASLEAWGAGAPKVEAGVGEPIGLTLDTPIFVERGQLASHTEHPPLYLSAFGARIFWLGRAPLTVGQRVTLKVHTAEVSAELRRIVCVIDTDTLKTRPADSIARGEIAEVTLRVRGLVAVDVFTGNPATGRFVLMEQGVIAGGGIIDPEGYADQRVDSARAKSAHITPYALPVTPEQRARINGHTGGILWLTGLSGAGKSTIAQELEKCLFAKGMQVFVLDGDNMRKGLCRDLGFSSEDRHENIRRASEVAALFAEAGFIVITSFITPTRQDRKLARAAAPQHYHSVYIKADLATCEKRDAKGLYTLARQGKIAEFTGISAPYEEPKNPDIIIDTMENDVEICVAKLLAYAERQFATSLHASDAYRAPSGE